MLLFREDVYEQDLLSKNISKKINSYKTLNEKKKDLDDMAKFEKQRVLFIEKISRK